MQGQMRLNSQKIAAWEKNNWDTMAIAIVNV